MRKFRQFLIGAAAFVPAVAHSQQVEFVPPSDSVGAIYSINANDAYSGGRGVVFSPTANFTLSSVGIYQNLTNVNLAYQLTIASAPTGAVCCGAILSSGNQTVTTSGLQFVNFSFAPILLNAGTFYFLDFEFAGTSNQNFFYNQSGAEPYSQAGFTGIDGTQAGDTSNFVLPRIRLNPLQAPGQVPEPATWAMMIVGFGAMGLTVRRSSRKVRMQRA